MWHLSEGLHASKACKTFAFMEIIVCEIPTGGVGEGGQNHIYPMAITERISKSFVC